MQGQLSGYGADHRTILRFYDLAVQRLGGKGLDEWQTDDLPAVVNAFLDIRFPTVIVCRRANSFSWHEYQSRLNLLHSQTYLWNPPGVQQD